MPSNEAVLPTASASEMYMLQLKTSYPGLSCARTVVKDVGTPPRTKGGHNMTAADETVRPAEEQVDKGLKGGALGLVSSIVMGVASTAPAYSLAATLGFIVAAVGLGSPIVAVLAFVPMLLTSIGYSELNKADPDCGTTFTWATRAFGPKTGWAGGWGTLAADIWVMASLAQVAGQYMFLLFNNKSIGTNPASSWVLLLGVAWII